MFGEGSARGTTRSLPVRGGPKPKDGPGVGSWVSFWEARPQRLSPRRGANDPHRCPPFPDDPRITLRNAGGPGPPGWTRAMSSAYASSAAWTRPPSPPSSACPREGRGRHPRATPAWGRQTPLALGTSGSPRPWDGVTQGSGDLLSDGSAADRVSRVHVVAATMEEGSPGRMLSGAHPVD